MAKKQTAGSGKQTVAAKRQKPAASDSQNRPMIVIASGDRPLTEVTTDLKEAGFSVGEVLHAIGQVTGNAPPALKGRLKKIHGVADVTETHADFDIGPPGAPVS